MIQNVTKIDQALNEEREDATTTIHVRMSKLIEVADDTVTKVMMLKRSDYFKSALIETLKACCSKISPRFEENQVILSYDSTINERTNFELVSSWLKKAEDVFYIFLRKLAVKNVIVPKHDWYSVIHQIKEITVINTESVAVFLKSPLQTVTIVGDKESVEDIFQTIQSLKETFHTVSS